MQTFYEWLSQLNLLRRLDETYFTFYPAEYNRLFDEELRQVIARTSDAAPPANLKKDVGIRLDVLYRRLGQARRLP